MAQATVEDIYRRFLGHVAEARKLTVAQVDEIAQGRVWEGGVAQQKKLVDRFGPASRTRSPMRRSAPSSPARTQAPAISIRKGAAISRILQLFGADDGDEARLGAKTAAPRDWLSLTAMRQQQWTARALHDLRALAEGIGGPRGLPRVPRLRGARPGAASRKGCRLAGAAWRPSSRGSDLVTEAGAETNQRQLFLRRLPL